MVTSPFSTSEEEEEVREGVFSSSNAEEAVAWRRSNASGEEGQLSVSEEVLFIW